MKWTDEKNAYFIELTKTKTAKEIASIMNISYETVLYNQKRLNVHSIRKTIWSDEKIAMLKELCKEHTLSEVAKIMNMKHKTIYKQARKLNINIKYPAIPWTNKDINYLRTNYGVISIEKIAKTLNRSVLAITHKANDLKLGDPVNMDMSILRINDVCDIMGVSRNTVINYWARLGLKIKKRRLSSKKFIYVIEWPDLLSFLKNNLDVWDSRRVDLYMLGEEYPWLKIKREKDSILAIHFKRYTYKEDILILKLFKSGKTYKEIAEILNRTPKAIKSRILDFGFNTNNLDEISNDTLNYIKIRALKKESNS